MTIQNSDTHRRMPSQAALRVLEVFSEAAMVSFDRTIAIRALGEAERAIPGNDWQGWSRRLIEVAESLHLRIRSIESSLDDALTFLRQGTPVATCVIGTHGRLSWMLLAGVKGRRIRVVATSDQDVDAWIEIGRLRKML